MKEWTKRPIDFNKVEFWAATTMYVFSVFLLVSKATQGNDSLWTINSDEYTYRHLEYSYFSNYFIPKLIRYSFFYCAYLLLTLSIIPPLVKKERIWLNIIMIIILFIILSIMLGTTDTWIKGYLFADYKNKEEVYETLFKSNFIYCFWLMMIFAFYQIIKSTGLHFVENTKNLQVKNQLLNRDTIFACIIWMIGFFLLLISDAPEHIIGVFGFIVPFSIGLYWYSLYLLIPQARVRKNEFRSYLWKVLLILVISIFPLSLLIFVFMNIHSNAVAAINLLNAACQLLVTAPLSWYVYKQRLADNYELTSLKTALGNSSANLDFLRSQINPHFLFNALNTLYGTALQENADRTGEGIQKLGDMMRFMLEENMQEKITLNREIDYINNYIGLQRLRTQSSPDIVIQTDIDNQVNNLSITPMLLIPFIENSFKHGISLREPSHIKITLQIQGNGLYFDVYNSIHIKADNDPEKNKSGIGLNNVKQRLQLLYLNRHELIIRENAKEFFVHLTMQL
jgi:two-component system LytT family sensor kinase